MTTKTFAVAAIESGTVIDHIPAGIGLKIIRLLELADHDQKVTVGLNLPSQSLGAKDMIKVTDWELPEDKANQVAILAPNATISIIRDYSVSRKFSVSIPDVIEKVINCPNSKCISNHEPTASAFVVNRTRKEIELHCRFCRKSFNPEKFQVR